MSTSAQSVSFVMPAVQTAVSQDPTFIRRTFASIARRYDLANHVLSGGLDFLWRRRAGRIVRSWEPRILLDLATGSGDLAITLGHYCPNTGIIGSDFCFPMLLEAKRKSVSRLVAADGMRLPFADGCFDAVTVAFGLRNMESWSGALREMRRVLRRGGGLLVLDFSLPRPPLQAVYRFYLHHVLPRIAGALTGDRAAYEYLGGSIEKFPSGKTMCELIAGCGFAETNCEPLCGGIVSLYTALANA